MEGDCSRSQGQALLQGKDGFVLLLQRSDMKAEASLPCSHPYGAHTVCNQVALLHACFCANFFLWGFLWNHCTHCQNSFL